MNEQDRIDAQNKAYALADEFGGASKKLNELGDIIGQLYSAADPVIDQPIVTEPIATPPASNGKLSCELSSASIGLVGSEPPYYGGGTFLVAMNWFDDNNGYAGEPPVEGLRASVGEIKYRTQYETTRQNVYEWTLPSYGPITDVDFFYGEIDDNGVKCKASAVFTLAAKKKLIPVDMGVKRTGVEGFGCDSNFCRDLEKGAKVIPVTNLNDSGAGSFRAAVDGASNRYVIPLVSGTVTSKRYIDAVNPKMAILGAAAKMHLRLVPTDGYCTLILKGRDQIIRYMTLSSGQYSGSAEDARKPLQSYGVNHVVDHNTLLFGVDDIGTMYQDGVSDLGTWCYNMMAFGLMRSHKSAKSSGKGLLISDGDSSIHHNVIVSTAWRGPQLSGKFADHRNNLTLSAGDVILGEVYKKFDTYANSVDNILLTPSDVIDVNASRHGLEPRNSGFKSHTYISGNVHADGSPVETTYNRGDANWAQYNEILDKPVTISPHTGRAVPSITTHSTSELESHLLPQVGAYLAGRCDVENDVIRRINARSTGYYDAVADDGQPGSDAYPQTWSGDANVYARKYPTWPTIPANLTPNPAFDLSQADLVPNAWKASKGIAANADTTKIDLNGDGVPAFELFYDEVTGCAPF